MKSKTKTVEKINKKTADSCKRLMKLKNLWQN